MANDVSKDLLRFALKNSGLKKPAHESHDIENENLRNIAKLSISKNKKIADASELLLNMMAESGNNQSAKNLVEHKADLYNKRSVTNTKNASCDRKSKPSKNRLLEFKDEWVKNYSLEHGWKKAAIREFNISYQTINSIIEEI